MTEKQNFWQTFPGVIAGIATILTAVVGIMSVVGRGGDDAPESASPTATATTTSSPTSGSSSSGSGSSGSVAPKLVVAPKSLDFGQLGSGKTANQTVTVANSGNEYLVVDGAAIDGRDDVFSADASECLGDSTGIAPDDECEITVSFTPGSPGTFAGFLEIEHSGNDSPTRVSLSGEGRLLDL